MYDTWRCVHCNLNLCWKYVLSSSDKSFESGNALKKVLTTTLRAEWLNNALASSITPVRLIQWFRHVVFTVGFNVVEQNMKISSDLNLVCNNANLFPGFTTGYYRTLLSVGKIVNTRTLIWNKIYILFWSLTVTIHNGGHCRISCDPALYHL